MTYEQKLNEVEAEVKRFTKKLKAAKERVKEDNSLLLTGCKETGALRRAALDLKNELTNITKTYN